MSNFDYETALFSYLNNLKQQMANRPLNLGGVFGTSGGAGGPPGGFVGQLPQSRVAFDTTEAETWAYPVNASGDPSGVSLIHNLNRIRYRIADLENVTVTGDGIAKITVSATAPTSPEVGDLWVDIS